MCLENKTIFIAHNWLETSFNRQSVELAKFFSIHNKVLFLNAQRRGISKEKINNGLSVYEWPGKKPVTLKDFFFAWRLMKKHKPDVIISNFSANNIMLLTSWLFRSKVRICYYHTMVKQYIADKGRLDTKQQFNIWRKKFFFKKATHIIAPSSAAKKDLVAYYKVDENKVHVFPNALYDHHKKNEKQEFVVGFVGRLHRSKGVDILIEAFGMLHKELPLLKLKIVGSGSEQDNLKKQVEDIALSNVTEFKGALANDEVIDFLTSVSCLVVPSRWDNQPTTIMEAFSTATAVIASNAGGISEIINHNINGLLFEKADAKDLYRQLKRIFTEDGLKNLLAENGRVSFIEKYNLESWTKRFEKLIVDSLHV